MKFSARQKRTLPTHSRPAMMAEEGIHVLKDDERAALTMLDALTGAPHDDDQLLYAIPVCAPYHVLANSAAYKYKVKLTPGAQKKGKVAKMAMGLFAKEKPTERERELMKAVTDDELVRVMIGNVKLAAAGVAQAARQQKAEKKAAATARRKAAE